ncbi:hypothetical protein ANCCAN_03829 [Ancylostoma caninum]|uniref:Uncharacterized protein n=1 Tax=Ancylostoma caninum TaxID=29170 RepID=A0A368H059_ANCCA|nr:hypothetical protein ANCCAN_03829 [Ancylostoma caninum]
MCDRDRLCHSRTDEADGAEKQESVDDPDDYGYHTPKNIFNAEMSRLSQMQLSYTQQTPPTPESDADEEENPYSTIKKCPLRSSMVKNLESLIQKNATVTQQKTRSVFYNDVSMDNMLRELESAPLAKKLSLLARLRDIDHVDIALFISFVLLIIFGLFGFYILLNEF